MSTESQTTVVLSRVPDGLLDGLPDEDQTAIKAAIGHPMIIVGHDERGWMELEFRHNGDIHTIWVDPAESAS